MSETYRDTQYIQLGGRQYPKRTSSTCHTCQSSHRLEIEEYLLKGYGYTAIENFLPDDAGVSAGSISAHYKNGHMALEDSVQRAMVESRAKEMGRDLDAEASLVDHVTLARLGVQHVYERIADGDLKPDVKDGIAFANLLMKSGMFEGSEVDQQAMVEAFGAYMEAAEAVMTPDQMHQFARMLAGHPVLRALHRQEAKRGLEAAYEVEDAQVISDEEGPAE